MSSTPRAGLAIAVVLAAVAGCVDAIGFERVFDVFPANQSGNAVLLGIALGNGSSDEAWRPALAIFGFGFGITLALLISARVRAARRTLVLLGLETLLLVPLAVVLLEDPRGARLDHPAVAVLLALTACAMGVQTEVIGRHAGIAISTTFQTGAITRVAESVAQRISPGARSSAIGAGTRVLLLVLIGYIGGATVGAALHTSRLAMVVPVVVLVATGAVLSVDRRA